MGLRDLYNRFEKVATPIANDVTRSAGFGQAVKVVGGMNKTVRGEVNKMAARAWHVLNLPAGTDVQRLKVQLGALDREIRLLTQELERRGKEARDGRSTESDGDA